MSYCCWEHWINCLISKAQGPVGSCRAGAGGGAAAMGAGGGGGAAGAGVSELPPLKRLVTPAPTT